MSTTTKKQELKPKAPISNRPTLQQLIAYYPSLSYTKVVKYRDYVLKECPDPINDSRDRFRNFVEKQFVQFYETCRSSRWI